MTTQNLPTTNILVQTESRMTPRTDLPQVHRMVIIMMANTLSRIAEKLAGVLNIMKEKKNTTTRRRKGTSECTLLLNSMATTGSLLIQEASPGSFIRKEVAVRILEGTTVISMKSQNTTTLKAIRPTLLVQRVSHTMRSLDAKHRADERDLASPDDESYEPADYHDEHHPEQEEGYHRNTPSRAEKASQQLPSTSRAGFRSSRPNKMLSPQSEYSVGDSTSVSEYSQTSAMRGAQELLRKNRQKRLEM